MKHSFLFYILFLYAALAVTFTHNTTAEPAIPFSSSISHPSTVQHSDTYEILSEAAHDASSFTQGWIMDGDAFIESSGLYGRSHIVRYDQSNIEQAKYRLPKSLFAEGIASNGKDLILLTWKKQLAIKLDKTTLKPIEAIPVQGQGWGLTHTGQHWAMSNGSNQILLRDNNSFDVIKKLNVHGFNRQWQKINELEYAEGLIWANIWQESLIIAINPNTGEVQKQYDLSKIVAASTRRPMHEALNGIAYDKHKKAFWITGKFWPKRYLIRFK